MTNNNKIKVGFLVSYDYELLKISIPRIYKEADSITLAIDHKRRTWSGNSIEIPNTFFDWVKKIDIDNKIKIYEDDFYVPNLSTKENDTRERNMLGQRMGEGGWHIQVDSDEYFVDFHSFCNYLRQMKTDSFVSICPLFVTIFKKLENSILYISGNKNYYPVATNHPIYKSYRGNDTIQRIEIDHLIIHDSWGRSEKDLLLKLNNWSHKEDFDVMEYYHLWASINKTNYKCVNHFHPFIYNEWRHLSEIKGDEIDDFIKNISIEKIYSEYENELILASKQPLLSIIKEKIKNKFSKK